MRVLVAALEALEVALEVLEELELVGLVARDRERRDDILVIRMANFQQTSSLARIAVWIADFLCTMLGSALHEEETVTTAASQATSLWSANPRQLPFSASWGSLTRRTFPLFLPSSTRPPT